MRKGVVSVVLPIYNVEKYLDRCLQSVVNQTYRNLEIVLVDDGSPDRCPKMCEEWAKRDDRIKVVHKKNAGLGMARNTGIENATGEFICFLDSDDYIARDAIEKAYRCAKEHDAEIVLFGFNGVNRAGKIVSTTVPAVSKNVYRDEEILGYILPNLIAPDTSTGGFTNLWMSVWGGLYSMELIDRTNWRCTSEREIISEDVYSLLRLYRDVQKVAILPEALYFYCENAASLTHTYQPGRFERIKHFYNACMDTCDELGYSDRIRRQLSYPFLSFTIAAMKMIAATDCTRQEQLKELDAVVTDATLQKVLRTVPPAKDKLTRRLLLEAAKRKQTGICYLLLVLKEKLI